MGEEYQYDAMMADIERMEGDEAERLASSHREDCLRAEAIFARMPSNGWQAGCPFLIGDVVFSTSREQTGNIIGLPTKDDVEAQDFRCNKAWVMFEDAARAWVSWTDIKHVRRSPVREKRQPSIVLPTATIQLKLFATSRKRPLDVDSPASSSGSSSASTPQVMESSTPQAKAASIERDRVIPNKPPAAIRGRQVVGRSTRETSISIPSRINEFPNHGFRDSAGNCSVNHACA